MVDETASLFPMVPLGRVAKVKSGFAFKSKDWKENGVPVIKIANVKAGRLVMDGCSFVDETVAKSASMFELVPGDILIAMTGYIGEVAKVRDEGRCLLNQRVGRFSITDEKRLDRDYLFLWLADSDTKATMEHLGYGSAQPNVSPTLIESVEIPLPPLPEQRAIAGVLGALDDKIEANRKTARVLEGIARAVFTSWFVDFDPVRANIRRREHAALGRAGRFISTGDDITISGPSGKVIHRAGDAAQGPLAALFPTRLVDSAIGEVPEIPEGWTASILADHFNLTMGQSPPGSTYNETGDGLPFYQGRTDYGFRFPTPRVYCTAPTRFAEPGDTLVSVRAPVGDVNMAIERCAVGRGVAAVRHKSGSRSLTYYAMHALRAHFLRFEADGTVFGAIGKTDFERLPLVAPPPPVVAAFEKFAGPIDQRIEGCERQSATLAALRDALLPKLISGELRIADAEKIVGRTV